jgi:hypothetical protein
VRVVRVAREIISDKKNEKTKKRKNEKTKKQFPKNQKNK